MIGFVFGGLRLFARQIFAPSPLLSPIPASPPPPSLPPFPCDPVLPCSILPEASRSRATASKPAQHSPPSSIISRVSRANISPLCCPSFPLPPYPPPGDLLQALWNTIWLPSATISTRLNAFSLCLRPVFYHTHCHRYMRRTTGHGEREDERNYKQATTTSPVILPPNAPAQLTL